MDDDDFNYEPEDLNSNDENEHKAKLYHFEDVPDVNIEEQKKIMDEIQQNNKKKEDEGNIFDLISEHGDNDKDKSKHDNIEIDDLLDEGEVKKNPPISTLKPNDYINNIDNENKAKEIKDDDIDEVLDINDEMFIAHKEKEKKQEEIKKEPIIQKEPSVHNEPPVYNNAEDEEPIEELDIDNHIEENKVEDKKVGEHQIEEKTHRNIVNEVKEDNTLKNNKDKKDDEEEDYNFDNLLSDHEGKEKEDDDDIFMTRQKAPIKSELPKKEIEEPPKKVEPLIVKPKPQPIKKKAELDDDFNYIESLPETKPQSSSKSYKKQFTTDKDRAEDQYLSLKAEITSIVNSPETSNIQTLNKENAKMLSIFSQLNDVLTLLTETSRVKSQKVQPKPKHIVDPSTNNEKIFAQYKKEYSVLQKRKKQLDDTSYTDRIVSDLDKISEDKVFYAKEIKRLRSEQKLSEIKLSRQMKMPTKAEVNLKRIEMDYENMKKRYDVLVVNIEKNKQKQTENEIKIKELNEFKEKLEKIAMEMYGIKEFVDVSNENKTIKEKEKKLELLKKKIIVFDSAKEVNKKKYEVEIAKKERDIYEMEQNKLRLLKKLKEENIKSQNAIDKVNQVYAPIFKMQEVKEEAPNPIENITTITPIDNSQFIPKKPEENESHQLDIVNQESAVIKKEEINIPEEEKKIEEVKPIENNEGEQENLVVRYPLGPVHPNKGNSRKPNFGNMKLNDLVQSNSTTNPIVPPKEEEKPQEVKPHPVITNIEIKDLQEEKTKEEIKSVTEDKKEEIKNEGESNDGIKEDIALSSEKESSEINKTNKVKEDQPTIQPPIEERKKTKPSFLEGFDDNEDDNIESHKEDEPKENDLHYEEPISTPPKEDIDEHPHNILDLINDNKEPEVPVNKSPEDKAKEEEFNNLFSNQAEPEPKKVTHDIDDFDNLEEFVI